MDKMRLKRIEPGVYETIDGKYQIERILALGEEHSQIVWILNRWTPVGLNGMWQEIYDADTKRECVSYLTKFLEGGYNG